MIKCSAFKTFDVKKKQKDIPCTTYTYLAQFTIELEGIFIES